jgi:hypothetical protein
LFVTAMATSEFIFGSANCFVCRLSH